MSEENLPKQYDNSDTEEFGNEDYELNSDLDTSDSAVAINKTSKIIGVILLSSFIVLILYYFFSSEKEKAVREEEKNKVQVYDNTNLDKQVDIAPAPQDEIDPIVDIFSPEEEVIPDVVSLEVPELPDLEVAKLPSAEDFNVVPEFSDEDIFNNQESAGSDTESLTTDTTVDLDNDQVQLEVPSELSNQSANSKSEVQSMMLFNGGDIVEEEQAQNLIENTSAETSVATKIKFPKRTIAQGKLIDSILETAINSDFSGKVRAIISRDVYADFSSNILIPKGSRLVGSYKSAVQRGQNRIFITWERIIRPDAIDIQIDAQATDQFGRIGVGGNVDNKYLELFNNSILLSLLTIGTAAAVEGATNSDGITTQTSENGTETNTSTPTDLAAQEMINSLGSTAKNILEAEANISPTITIPQGTRVNVFVNQDLVFPKNSVQSDVNNVIFIK